MIMRTLATRWPPWLALFSLSRTMASEPSTGWFNGGRHGDSAGSLMTCRTAVSTAKTWRRPTVLSQTPPAPCITAYRAYDTIAFTAIRNRQAASVGSESIDTCVCFTWYLLYIPLYIPCHIVTSLRCGKQRIQRDAG